MRRQKPSGPSEIVVDDRPLPLGVSIAETCQLIGVERDRVYRYIAEGELTISKLGRRTVVHTDSIRQLLRKTVVTPKSRVRRVRHGAVTQLTSAP
jgi:excisionase family DNA binding protein